MAEDSGINEFGRHFVMGGVSAAIAKTAAAPIERVKLLLQNESALVRAGVLDSPYRGVFDCFRRVYTSEGLVAFWRGNSANVIREVPTQALAFSLHDHYRQFFASDPADGYWRYFAGNVASGSAAGSTALLVVYPLDYARTRLANDAKASSKGGVENAASPSSSSSSSRQFNGLFDVFRKTVASDGVAGLYRGFVPSIAGAVVYRGLQFGLYDTLKPIVLVGPLEHNFPASFALGWSVVAMAGLCAYPLDTIRRRMMMTSGTGTHYRNFLVAASTIVKQEGSASLMRGALANIIRGVASAGILSIYDRAQSELS